MKHTCLFSFLLLFVWSCSSTSSEEEPVTLIPLEIGNQWVLRFTPGIFEQIDTMTVVRDTVIDGVAWSDLNCTGGCGALLGGLHRNENGRFIKLIQEGENNREQVLFDGTRNLDEPYLVDERPWQFFSKLISIDEENFVFELDYLSYVDPMRDSIFTIEPSLKLRTTLNPSIGIQNCEMAYLGIRNNILSVNRRFEFELVEFIPASSSN